MLLPPSSQGNLHLFREALEQHEVRIVRVLSTGGGGGGGSFLIYTHFTPLIDMCVCVWYYILGVFHSFRVHSSILTYSNAFVCIALY